MKVLYHTCTQPSAYADSRGTCIIALTKEDNVEEIIDRYTSATEWYEEKFTYPRIANRVVCDGNIFEGDLLIFDTLRIFLDWKGENIMEIFNIIHFLSYEFTVQIIKGTSVVFIGSVKELVNNEPEEIMNMKMFLIKPNETDGTILNIHVR